MNYRLLLLALLPMLMVADATVKGPICADETTCADLDSNCQCYCSRKCGYREKEVDDAPIYIKNDPTGIKCWCKQWDKDNYKRCKNKEKNKKSKRTKRMSQPSEY